MKPDPVAPPMSETAPRPGGGWVAYLAVIGLTAVGFASVFPGPVLVAPLGVAALVAAHRKGPIVRTVGRAAVGLYAAFLVAVV